MAVFWLNILKYFTVFLLWDAGTIASGLGYRVTSSNDKESDVVVHFNALTTVKCRAFCLARDPATTIKNWNMRV